MTMADERTRALRFGWEFLLEMRDSDCLTAEQFATVGAILRHYPSALEINQWALECVQAADEPMLRAPDLAPEEPTRRYPDDCVAEIIERGPTTPQERAGALCQAYEFVRFGLLAAKNVNLTENLRRQIPYVLRHFPDLRELAHWVRCSEHNASQNPSFRAWLLPEVPSGGDNLKPLIDEGQGGVR